MTLTHENYRSKEAELAYMSVSQFKGFMKCESMQLAKILGKHIEEPSEAMLVGSFVDQLCFDPEKPWPEHVYDSRKKEKTIKVAYQNALDMFARLTADEGTSEMLKGEFQRILEGEIGGVKWKGMTDVINEEHKRIVDLKTTKDFDDKWDEDDRKRKPWYDGYWIQLTVYRELAEQCFFNIDDLYIVGITKQEPSDIGIFKFNDEERMLFEFNLVCENSIRYDEIKRGYITPTRCEKCEYCRATKKAKITIAISA